MNIYRRFCICALLFGVFTAINFAVVLFPQSALGASDEATKIFAGKQIRIIVAYSPGGGFDVIGRLMARHLSKHIPGNPLILVDNMTGAGGAVATNYVYARSKPDGMTWLLTDGAVILSKILGLPGPDYDVEKFSWLGVAQGNSDACMVMTRTGIKNANQFLHSDKPVRIGATAVGDGPHIRPAIASEAVGANFKIVLGYGGTSDMRLAMQTGDTDAACWSWESMRVTAADLFKAKEAIPILQIAPERHPDIPDVPNILDFPMSEDSKSMLKLVMSAGVVAKLFAAPPSVPQNILEILRKSFADTLKDPGLIAEIKKLNTSIAYIPPDQITKIVKEMISTPKEIKNRVAEIAHPKK